MIFIKFVKMKKVHVSEEKTAYETSNQAEVLSHLRESIFGLLEWVKLTAIYATTAAGDAVWLA